VSGVKRKQLRTSLVHVHGVTAPHRLTLMIVDSPRSQPIGWVRGTAVLLVGSNEHYCKRRLFSIECKPWACGTDIPSTAQRCTYHIGDKLPFRSAGEVFRIRAGDTRNRVRVAQNVGLGPPKINKRTASDLPARTVCRCQVMCVVLFDSL
jgi:hypothetical protein